MDLWREGGGSGVRLGSAIKKGDCKECPLRHRNKNVKERGYETDSIPSAEDVQCPYVAARAKGGEQQHT
jgi:hypothetical protein